MSIGYCGCRYSAGEQAHILFSVGIKDASELSSLMQRLNDRNMPTQDLSSIEAAQVLTHGYSIVTSVLSMKLWQHPVPKCLQVAI